MIKKLISIALTIILSGCGIAKTFLYAATSPEPNYKVFPLGENKKILIEIEKTYIEKPYLISLRTEFIDGSKHPSYKVYKELNYPFELEIKGYKKSGNDYSLFITKIITQNNISYDNDSITENPKNSAFTRSFGFITLPAGQYRFEITDRSKPIDKYKKIQTSIDIFVDTSIK
ncbi:hypothetical protein [Neisseria chenwenguii]|uniref:Uncharacterized protein n=1 Tax=Neisseria chenwenguii TaxID=1853278 RepID=A0A220S2W5_9NEIS|nr:hypothetical protein [Neisseria chenwenguii]ASK27728.1 hypothetical protein BG910_08245 [Neisseria chenwenguii]ROV51901.1 hypothetical protein EGS38_12000 [Neisseria chenwenguii]